MDNPQYPLGMHDVPLHDPFVLADTRSGMYYLYNANYYQYRTPEFGDGVSVVMYASPDLVHFSEPRNVLDVTTAPDGAWYDDCDSPWAPEVHEWRGRYWMLVTLHGRRRESAAPTGGPAWYREGHRLRERRGMFAAVADTPEGPFRIVDPERPITPPDDMTLDGTLAVDRDGAPWMIYAHEWVQLFDGTMEAVRLDPGNLSRAVGEPVLLWRASEGLWHEGEGDAPAGGWNGDFSTPEAERLLPPDASGYVTDGPFVQHSPNGSLLSVWTSYSRGEYILAQAISRSGTVSGPWEQLPTIDHRDAGHAMIFRMFDGTPLLIMHTNMTRNDESGEKLPSHGIVYEIDVTDDGFVLGRHRADLDGIADPDHDR